jgi:hypothetical protein
MSASLAKHWHGEGRYVEAFSLLESVYNWFAEGFDTQDLKGAKAGSELWCEPMPNVKPLRKKQTSQIRNPASGRGRAQAG